MCSQYTDIWPTYTCMYLFIGVFTLDAHPNAHQMEANRKHIESILFTLVFEIHKQCALYVLMVTQLLHVIKWPTRLPVLLLFNCTWLRLKHERDRRRENIQLRRYTAVPGFNITQPWGLLPMWLTHETGSKTNAHRNQCASCVNAQIPIQCALQR